MVYEVIMPLLGETMEDGTIVDWRKKVGDQVEKGEVLLVVESDKAVLEVESFFRGYLRKILRPVGEVVAVGKAIAFISDTMEEPIK